MDVDSSRLIDLRVEMETLNIEQELLHWRNYVYGDEVDVAQTYLGHEKLFSIDTLELIGEVKPSLSGDDAQALAYFENQLIAVYLQREVARHSDIIDNTTASAEVTLDGEKVPFRQLSGLLAQEEDYERRERIARAASEVIENLETTLLEREDDLQALALQLGYDGYVELGERIRMADFNSVAALSDAFIEAMDDTYECLLGEMAEHILGIPPIQLRRCDFPHMFRGKPWDSHFPADRLITCMKRTLAGLGIDLRDQKTLRIYSDGWDRKEQQAACFPIRVPLDVRITMKLVGGLRDYTNLFHEMGHAQHCAGTNQILSELRRLGPRTTRLSFAYLFEGLLETPAWLESMPGMNAETIRDLCRFHAFRKICSIRCHAAKLAYERWLHADGEHPRQRYQDLLSEAYGVDFHGYDSARHLMNVNDFFTVVEDLRAWFLHAQVVSHLESEWGPRWFESPEAGEFLKGLWSHGTRYQAEYMAGLWGKPILEADPLIERVEGML